MVNKEGLSIFQFNKNIIIIKAPIKNRIIRLLKVRFNKGGLITKSLPKEEDTNILILIYHRMGAMATKRMYLGSL